MLQLGEHRIDHESMQEEREKKRHTIKRHVQDMQHTIPRPHIHVIGLAFGIVGNRLVRDDDPLGRARAAAGEDNTGCILGRAGRQWDGRCWRQRLLWDLRHMQHGQVGVWMSIKGIGRGVDQQHGVVHCSKHALDGRI